MTFEDEVQCSRETMRDCRVMTRGMLQAGNSHSRRITRDPLDEPMIRAGGWKDGERLDDYARVEDHVAKRYRFVGEI